MRKDAGLGTAADHVAPTIPYTGVGSEAHRRKGIALVVRAAGTHPVPLLSSHNDKTQGSFLRPALGPHTSSLEKRCKKSQHILDLMCLINSTNPK